MSAKVSADTSPARNILGTSRIGDTSGICGTASIDSPDSKMTRPAARNQPKNECETPIAGSFTKVKSPVGASLWKKLSNPLVATIPFFVYIGIFLVAPTLIVIWGAFTKDGIPTLANLTKLFESNTIEALYTSLTVSAVSALGGATIGAVVSYLLVRVSAENGLARSLMLALSSVLAQFGGVMLAFAFIATIGINGIGTQAIAAVFGYQVDPNWLSSIPGAIVVYLYFQIPLMIIIFTPTITQMRPTWREATVNLGGSTWIYWLRVAGPILWPRFLGAFLLLFANAFSAYATAAALFSQRSILVPLMIQGALRNEQDVGLNGFAQALALLMVIVVAAVMAAYAWIQKRTAKWE